jgi:HSP20 family protein
MTTIERWNPFQEIETMRNWMDRWMDNGFTRTTNNMPSTFSPAVDIVQTETGYELHANLPGYQPEEIEVKVDRDTVTLKAQHEEKVEKNEDNYIYRERRSGSFYRSLRLPETIDGEKVEAHIENGVLKLTLPRLAQAQSRKVEVKTLKQ